MKNGTLRFIPLQADLCLNKQKVDITDFKGWQKCNAPVYGDCLSPLYKKEDTHHDIYIKNDTYDFSSGVLSKNGTPVLSGAGSKKLKKTKLSDNYSSIKVTADDQLTWCKETGSNSITMRLGSDEVRNITIANCTRIIATKCFGNSEHGIYGCVVWYIHTTGKYGYWVGWNTITGSGEEITATYRESYGADDPSLFDNWEVVSPLIQANVPDANNILISFFGNSGANISSTQVKNVIINQNTVHDNPAFYDGTNYPTRYKTSDVRNWMHIYMSSTRYMAVGRDYDATNDYAGAPCVTIDRYVQSITITMFQTFGTPITVDLWYWDVNDDRVYPGRTITIPADETRADVEIEIFGAWRGHRDNNERETNIGYLYFVNGNSVNSLTVADTLMPPMWNPNGFFVSGAEISYLSNNKPDNPREAGTDTTHTYLVPSKQETGVWELETRYRYFDSGNTLRASSTETITDIYNRLKNSGSTYYGKTSKTNNYLMAYPTKSEWGNPVWLVDDYYNQLTNRSGEKWFNTTTEGRFAFVRYYKTAYTEQALKECDCILDDGRLYCVNAITNDTENPIPTKLFALAGEFTSYDSANNKVNYTSIATFDISYQQEETNIYPKYWYGMSINLQDKYLRVLYKFKKNLETDEIITFMIDSTSVKADAKNIILYPGELTDTENNVQGACLNSDGWRLVFNNNMLSNVACYENQDYIGTILADWLTIDTDFHTTFNQNKLYYKDNSNNIWCIEKVDTGEEWQYKVVENRYIVLNTTNYFNCYDTQTGLKRHWASDYNNRIIFGYAFSYYSVGGEIQTKLQEELFRGLLITGQNANYERTNDPITGIEFGALVVERCLKDYLNFVSCSEPYGAIESISLYRGDGDSTSALYICSYQNGMKYIDTDLTNPFAVYPIDQNGNIRYNPNLFTQFVASYNNKDMAISDGIAYKLLYFNNVIPVMSYYLLDGVENLENAFVLQSSFYGVTPTRLYQMNYTNGVGVDVIADITNMEYLGALPSQALFWSAQNRAIYTFKGNCIMELAQYANDLTKIFGKWYNPATQELFLDTNIGLLVFSDLGTYCLEWSTETQTATVKDIFFFTDYFIINIIGDATKSYYYSYNKKTGYESNKVYFITKYYGNGLVPITVNNIYVRLYDQAEANAEGFIKMKGYTITDKGTQTDTKEVLIGGEDNPEAEPPTVAGEAWDEQTGTMLVKYTPQYNRGLGFALEVESTFPIIDIKFDYVENGTIESQIAHVNI